MDSLLISDDNLAYNQQTIQMPMPYVIYLDFLIFELFIAVISRNRSRFIFKLVQSFLSLYFPSNCSQKCDNQKKSVRQLFSSLTFDKKFSLWKCNVLFIMSRMNTIKIFVSICIDWEHCTIL